MSEDKQTMGRGPMTGHRPTDAGFTLVELMISVALLGMVMTVIFSLFSTTSDSLREADSLAHTLERARFSVEQISSDIRSAGAFASPDSINDPRIAPAGIGSNSQIRVIGVASYDGWQNDDSLFSADIQDAHTPTDGYANSGAAGTQGTTTSGSAISFDGFIVMGAIDFPQTFEIGNISFNGSGEADGAWIPATPSSLHKLVANDPFYIQTDMPGGAEPDEASEIVIENLQNRLVRVMDRSGKVQLSGVSYSDAPEFADDGLGGSGISFKLRDNWAVQNSEGHGETEHGLERSTSGDEDIRYSAALVDAYWYHVEQDPEDPVNYRLVRERLDAHAVATQLRANPNAINPGTLSSTLAARDGDGNIDRDKVVITDRVVDFQVWFDCANAQGNVINVPWQMRWPNPLGVSDPANDCMEPASATVFGQARMAHVRLSVRTAHERKDAPDDPNAIFMNDDGQVDALMPVRFFDMNPDAEGAARVVTVQSDVELSNYGMRNITPAPAATP